MEVILQAQSTGDADSMEHVCRRSTADEAVEDTSTTTTPSDAIEAPWGGDSSDRVPRGDEPVDRHSSDGGPRGDEPVDRHSRTRKRPRNNRDLDNDDHHSDDQDRFAECGRH